MYHAYFSYLVCRVRQMVPKVLEITNLVAVSFYDGQLNDITRVALSIDIFTSLETESENSCQTKHHHGDRTVAKR